MKQMLASLSPNGGHQFKKLPSEKHNGSAKTVVEKPGRRSDKTQEASSNAGLEGDLAGGSRGSARN
jgi:hypothetical protein